MTDEIERRNEHLAQAYDEVSYRNNLLNQAYSDIAVLQAKMKANELRMDIALQAQEDAKFYFYYVRKEQKYGVDNLHDYLAQWNWKEGAYAEGVFDCSQMSAYLEWKFENEGYHTIIVNGNSPDGDSNKHAWLLVETSEGKYTPVEATAYDIVSMKSPDFEKYFQYEFRFESIQEALEYNPREYKWWN
jgi:hypothetical protein